MHYLVIDSLYRNSGTPGSYVIDLPSRYKVKKIKLVKADIFNSIYTVSDVTLSVKINGGAETSLSLTNGYYTAAELVTHLAAVLNAVFGATWTATRNAVTGKITIAKTGTTSIEFLPYSKNVLLGIPRGGQSIAAAAMTFQYPVNLTYHRYMILKVNDFNRCHFSNGQEGFAPLLLESSQLITASVPEIHSYRKDDYTYFSPQAINLSQLTIKLTYTDGTICDMNGINHTLTFELS